jgi:hypothetical protein
MIIPNISTMTEEVIQVPYGRDRERESGSTLDRDSLPSGEEVEREEFTSPRGGLGGLSERLQADDDEDEVVVGAGTGNRSGDDHYEKLSYGRTSVTSDRSAGGGLRGANGRASVAAEDPERLRRDYEYKIATMQTQITNLQRELGDAGDNITRLRAGDSVVQQLEDELSSFRQVCSIL